MLRFDNEYARAGLGTVSVVKGVTRNSPSLNVGFSSGPDVAYCVLARTETPAVAVLGSVSVVSLPERFVGGGWRLKALLLAIVETDEGGYVASTWLHRVAEYGTGQTEQEALVDLVHSLGEYLESLEQRQCHLAASARDDLNHLRSLVEPAP